MTTVLRIARRPNLLTAEVYETLFEEQLGQVMAIRRAPLGPWFEAVLGRVGEPVDLAAAAQRFGSATRGIDFVCPSFEAIPLAPLLLALRNRAGSRVRLLFIAHAAAVYATEWGLMRPLLAPGDLLVTPSRSARSAVEALCPDVLPFVTVIPHPIAGPPARAPRPQRDGRVVLLGRVHAEKLVHRVVEGLACLRGRGAVVPRVTVAGALNDGGLPTPHPYTRTLREKIRRLALSDRVEFAGPVHGEARERLLGRASCLVNLSVTLEESCPKAPAEALRRGVPVLATAWNGLREVVGECGSLVPVLFDGTGFGTPDVAGEAVASQLEALLEAAPSPEACRAHGDRFAPERVLPRYRTALDRSLAAREKTASDPPEGPAVTTGLLATVQPLTMLSWREWFAHHVEESAAIRAAWDGAHHAPTPGARLRGLTNATVQPALQRIYAGGDRVSISRPLTGATANRRDFTDLVAEAARAGCPASRLACLAELVGLGRHDLAGPAMARLTPDAAALPGAAYLRADVAAARGDLDEAFLESIRSLEAAPATEADAPRLRQVARIARRAGCADAALPWLRAWLDRFPDSTESGPVWLDCGVSGYLSPHPDLAEAGRALGMARRLLGDSATLDRADAALARRAQPLIASPH